MVHLIQTGWGGVGSLQKTVLCSVQNIPPKEILPDMYKPVLILEEIKPGHKTRFLLFELC